MSEKLAKQLLDLKELIKSRELKIAEKKGQLSELHKQLSECDCISLEEAKTRTREIEARIEVLEEELEEGVQTIQEALKNVGKDS